MRSKTCCKINMDLISKPLKKLIFSNPNKNTFQMKHRICLNMVVKNTLICDTAFLNGKRIRTIQKGSFSISNPEKAWPIFYTSHNEGLGHVEKRSNYQINFLNASEESTAQWPNGPGRTHNGPVSVWSVLHFYLMQGMIECAGYLPPSSEPSKHFSLP